MQNIAFYLDHRCSWTEYINRLTGVLAGFCMLFTAIYSFTYWKSPPSYRRTRLCPEKHQRAGKARNLRPTSYWRGCVGNILVLSIILINFFWEEIHHKKKRPTEHTKDAHRDCFVQATVYSFILAMKQEPEENIFHKHDLIHRCNKIRNEKKRLEALEYFRSNDYS